MLILGLETSCDETAVALVEHQAGHFFVRKNLVTSQIPVHRQYGGVVPEVAARNHVVNIVPLLRKIMPYKKNIDVIAVTAGPGLATALLVGVETARALAWQWRKPLVAVNHLEGHIYANWLNRNQTPLFPALALIISGGHTELVLMKKHLQYRLIGQTRDDAAGECFDKAGKILGLPYPGGPALAKLAIGGNPQAVNFPRPMLESADFDFSFSGLKTSILYYLQKNPLYRLSNNSGYVFLSSRATCLPAGRSEGSLDQAKTQRDSSAFGLRMTVVGQSAKKDICASFQQAIIDVLITKTEAAVKKYKVRTLLIGGGVAANKALQKQLAEKMALEAPQTAFTLPNPIYCGDNAAMIAVAGYFHARKKDFTPWQKIDVEPNWEL